TKTTRVLLNGEDCSEFMIYSWCAAYYGVPTVFLSGDKMLTEDSAHLHPMLKTVWAKDGYGGYTRCRQPQLVCDLIRQGTEEALKQDLSKAMCELPKHFDLQISYKEHRDAARYVNYPGFEMVDSHTIRMQTDDYYEFLRCVPFVF
ncbi:MAG: M55 family metallopeptidase, partial [Firmicutes bacterium]|nr:M55 family metallopeptidase [Bacillota bacterium]